MAWEVVNGALAWVDKPAAEPKPAKPPKAEPKPKD